MHPAGDLVVALAVKPQRDDLDLVSLPAPDPLYGTAGINRVAFHFELLDVTPDGPHVHTQDARQILLRQDPALLHGLGQHPQDAPTTQPFATLLRGHSDVFPASIHRQRHFQFGAICQGRAKGRIQARHHQPYLARADAGGRPIKRLAGRIEHFARNAGRKVELPFQHVEEGGFRRLERQPLGG